MANTSEDVVDVIDEVIRPLRVNLRHRLRGDLRLQGCACVHLAEGQADRLQQAQWGPDGEDFPRILVHDDGSVPVDEIRGDEVREAPQPVVELVHARHHRDHADDALVHSDVVAAWPDAEVIAMAAFRTWFQGEVDARGELAPHARFVSTLVQFSLCPGPQVSLGGRWPTWFAASRPGVVRVLAEADPVPEVGGHGRWDPVVRGEDVPEFEENFVDVLTDGFFQLGVDLNVVETVPANSRGVFAAHELPDKTFREECGLRRRRGCVGMAVIPAAVRRGLAVFLGFDLAAGGFAECTFVRVALGCVRVCGCPGAIGPF